LSQASGRQFGKYTFIEPLAKGGMAETYRARFTGAAGVTKDVVIKKILGAYADDKNFVQMFINEAKIAATFSHGNIAQVFDFGEIDGEFFLAMELVDGQSLQQVLKRAKQMEIKEMPAPLALLILMRVCEGLHYAHTRLGEDGRPLRIVHRDVTPENVMISYEGQVKLVDFGIAKAKHAGNRTQTEPGMVKGKYHYFSPEQAAGQEVDHRTDVYAAGTLLYALLCGRLPFEGHAVQVMHRIVTEQVPLPRSINPQLSGVLERILLKALAKNVEERYQTAQAFGEALSAYLYREEPSFSPTRLASFMTYLFKPTLEAEGRKADVPEEFLRQLTAWREKSLESGHAANRKGGRILSAPVTAPEIPDEPKTEAGDSEIEVTQRTEHSPETSADSLVASEDTVAANSDAPESSEDATRLETISLPVHSQGSGSLIAPRKPRWALALTGLFVLAVVLPVGLLRLFRERVSEPVDVLVTSEPSNAWVVLDGKRVPGQTPMTIPGVIAGQKHRLTVLMEGAWKPFEIEFTPQGPGPYPIKALLEEAAPIPRPLGDGDPRTPGLKSPRSTPSPPEDPGSGPKSDANNEAHFPVSSFTVVAKKHHFPVNESMAKYQELNPNEIYKLWAEGSLTLNKDIGQSSRVVFYVTKGADGAPDTVGIATNREVQIQHAQALYAFVIDPNFRNNNGGVTLNLQELGSNKTQHLQVDARKHAVDMPLDRRFLLSGLDPGQSYRLTAQAPAGDSLSASGPGAVNKVACVSLLHQHESADGVTGGQILLEPGQSQDITGADSLECAYLDLGSPPTSSQVEIEVRAGPRPFSPPL